MLALVALQLFVTAHVAEASVTGTIRDAGTGTVIAGATISIDGAARTAFTDADGRYSVISVSAGARRMSVSSIGHFTSSMDVLVPARGIVRVDVTLAQQAVPLAPVSVIADRTAPSPGTSAHADHDARWVNVAALQHHPLLAEPDVVRALNGGDVFVRPETSGGLFVRGGASGQVSYTLDGIPTFNTAHLGALLGAWSTDALADAQLSVDTPDIRAEGTLSGALNATTRRAGTARSVRSAVSSTQMRVSADGPLTRAGAGFLIGVRQALPSLVAAHDPNFVRGESGDWLGAVRMPAARGALQLLMYSSADEFSSVREVSPASSAAPRNTFGWESGSLGMIWDRHADGAALRVAAWRAATLAVADWTTSSHSETLDSRRVDYGMQVVRTPDPRSSGTLLSARVDVSRTAYDASASDAAAPLRLHAVTPVATLAIERDVLRIGALRASFGNAFVLSRQGVALAPRAHAEWQVSRLLRLSASASRAIQHVQSLRNSESVTGHMFPADLYVGAGGGHVPVARGDQVTLNAEVLAGPQLTISGHAWARTMRGVLLAAERESGPFATTAAAEDGALPSANASASGLAADVQYRSSRVSGILSYGWQRVRYRTQTDSYTPEHAARQHIVAGMRIMAIGAVELHASGTAVLGRRATAVRGALEWDGCNLADRACEFAGAPESTPGALGELELPAYASFDIGVRREWRRSTTDRSRTVAIYGTLTNLLNRTNVLARSVGPGTVHGVEMRSRTPLVAGLEWTF